MNRSRSGYVYIALCAVIFSTMEVMLKTVHGVFAPMQITCLRFLVGGILLIPFASRSMKKKNASLSRKDIGFFALSGFLCIVIAMSLYQMSVTYTRASIVAVIFSCNPIFVTVFAHLFLHEDIHRNHIIALILELTAALIIIDPIHATLDPTGSVLGRDVRTLQCVRQKAYTALRRHRCYVPELSLRRGRARVHSALRPHGGGRVALWRGGAEPLYRRAAL